MNEAGAQTESLSGPRVLLLAVMDNWMFPSLVPSLRRLCSQVYACPFGTSMGQWHEPKWPTVRRRLMEGFLSDARSIARTSGIDLILMLQYDDSVLPGDVRAMRDLGAKVANYHVDMDRQWYRVLRQAPLLDLLAVSHMQHLKPLQRRGVPLHFMPMAASPDQCLQPASDDVPESGVLMLGSRSVNRAMAVAACRSVTDRVDVYGAYWTGPIPVFGQRRNRWAKRLFDLRYVIPRLMAEGPGSYLEGRREARRESPVPVDLVGQANLHGYAPAGSPAALMARAAITLGVNQRTGLIGDRRGWVDSRLRDFEAPLTGAFYLVQRYIDLPLFYRPGVEVETWSTLEELKRKVAYYIDRPEERRAIAQVGQARARAEHTWDTRLAALFDRLELPAREGGAMCPLHIVANLSSNPWCSDAPGCLPEGGAAQVPAPELERYSARPPRQR